MKESISKININTLVKESIKKQNSLFKKHSIKGEEPENLTYQFSWIQSKPWHVYSKDLHGNLVKVCVLFDRNSGSKPRGKFDLNCISRCS